MRHYQRLYPCELLQEAGLSPYNAEAFSCYLSASRAERGSLQQAENAGVSETLCSYHKTFLGAAQRGLLPKPRCIVYTSLMCDANLLTFRTLARMYGVPLFAIDVPLRQTEDNVKYVAGQLRELAAFLEEVTGRKIDAQSLRARWASAGGPWRNFSGSSGSGPAGIFRRTWCPPLLRHDQQHPAGHPQEEKYVDMLLRDVQSAPPSGASTSTGCTPSPSGPAR